MGLTDSGGRGDLVEVEIHDLSGSGAGVGRLPDGRVVFVPRTAPGDRVRIRIVRRRKSFANGELIERIRDSDLRRPPPCPLYDRCGGCQIQHLAYPHQVEWKGRRIAETLARVGGLELPVGDHLRGDDPASDDPTGDTLPGGVPTADDLPGVPVEPSPSEWHYRNRLRFTLRRIPLRDGPGRPRVFAGFHDRSVPGRIVDVHDQCLLPEAPILEVWTALRRAWGPAADRLPDGDELALTLRTAVDGVVLVVEGGGSLSRSGRRDMAALVEKIDGLLAVWHRPGQSDQLERVAGAEDRTDLWFGEAVPVGSKAFLQVNRTLGETLHLDVLAELGDPAGSRVIDAFCGVGGYGRRLAREGATAVGIELDGDAVEAARRDAPAGWSVVEGRVEDEIAALLPADAVILNPPRAGLDAAVPEALRATPPARIVYVSCDPATLARDLERLGEGWRIRRVRGFDLFPQTAHVESVVTLDRRG